MSNSGKFFLFVVATYCFFLLLACGDNKKPPEKDIVVQPAKLSERIHDDLEKLVDNIRRNSGKMNDSISLGYSELVDSIYESNHFQPLWSKDNKWLPLGDSLFTFIDSAKFYGLFPSDYYSHSLDFIHRIFMADSIAKKNAALWARADVLLTDAFFKLVKDIKQGRFPYDSVTLRTDTVLKKEIFVNTFTTAMQSGNIAASLDSLQPKYREYDSLKIYTKKFLATASFNPFTYLVYPYKDSVAFFKLLEKRLRELGEISPDVVNPDTIAFSKIFRKIQKQYELKLTGKLSDRLVDHLNDTDWEKFKQIAVNLDRYKLLPDTLPRNRAWVNLPAFSLQVFSDDTLVFMSRVIVGGPQTRTPLLSSEISNFMTYPQWTVPYSIIFKEMLPKIRQNVDFLNKENLMVIDKNDSVIDPTTINWYKLNKNHFPYLLKQRQGDDNSLGVIKFNFRNKYSVYMHDTNVRWMFGKPYRALSHGCVRVKEWQKLADFLIRTDTVKYKPDSLRAWIARQEKHVVSGFPKVPVYFRYFSCEGKDGRVKFYDDIYEEDRYLREKYFLNKTVE
ncbi:MAG: L,D-transpeptidase family protein [Bacteroidetes bacterium]|nr:L,D-transpeptidase family protein [Bacteroidota bacterium]